ncbi:MAG: sulfatase-like hydrolase/transferase [Candidatus Aminicenantes bacterium]|nr:sulfatase-like hydrolase/transferase [Candidatus Aminicenantes bacterium]
MKKRKHSLSFFVVFILVFFCMVYSVAAKSKGKGWNVLLITIDTLRTDRLSCYSREHLETPHIDSLAHRGVLFDYAFAHTSTTLPSHTNILLGRTPLYHGVHENSNFIVQEDHLTLAEFLESIGYSTGAFVGAYPLDSRFGLDQGFSTYDDEYGSQSARGNKYYVERKAEEVVDRALVWVKRQSSPWFMWVHVYDPHVPYEPPQPFKDRFKEDLYNGEVAYVDSELGKIFDYLESEKMYKNTLIVLTGDHGEGLGQHGEPTHGFFAYNTTIRIPLIFYFPGIEPGNVPDYVGHIDIFPSICEVLDLKKPDLLTGVSLLPAIKGKKLKHGPIYFESLYPFYSRGWAPLRGYIDNEEKYIESPIPEVYNLKEDFDEQNNLAQEKELNRYRKELDEIMAKYSGAKEKEALRTPGSETLRKLRSLGYVSGVSHEEKQEYGPEDDIKTLLPLYNKSIIAKQIYVQGKDQQAIRMLQEVITERKDIDVAYSNLATLYKEKGNLRGALLVLEEGMKNLPESHEIFSAYVNFLTEAGQSDRVISLFNEVGLREMDYDPELWNFLGIAYTRKGEYMKALEALDKAVSIDSDFASTYNNMGNAYLSIYLNTKNEQELQKAIENYQKAVEFNPEDAAAYNGLGAVYKQLGDLDKAVKAWEQSLSIDPEYGLPLYNLGYIHMERGNNKEALRHFVRYLDLYQNNIPAEKRRQIEQWIKQMEEKKH